MGLKSKYREAKEALAGRPARDAQQQQPQQPQQQPQQPQQPQQQPQQPQQPQRPATDPHAISRQRGRAAGVVIAPPSQLGELLTAEALKSLRTHLDRGSLDLKVVKLGKGLGDFEDVVDAADAFAAMSSGADKRQACTELLRVLDGYQTAERQAAFEHEEAKGRAGDPRTIMKHNAAMNLRREAARMLQAPIDQQFLQTIGDDPAQREAAHQARAEQLSTAFGREKAASGTSDVQLVKDSSGTVAYAFKSVEGESVQTHMAKGCGAVREAMASAMSNTVKTLCGLDFEFPQTSVVTLGGKSGALIEGMHGESYDPRWLEGKLGPDPGLLYRRNFDSQQAFDEADALRKADTAARDKVRDQYRAESEARASKACEMANKLSGKDLQKVLFSNYAMAQFDIKWDNLMMLDDGQDGAVARPFDAGAGFLADEALQHDPGVLAAGEGGPGYMLLFDPADTAQALPAAGEPLDDVMRRQLLALDLTALMGEMTRERARLDRDHGLGAAVLSDTAMLRSYRSIQIMKEILANPAIVTTADFVAAFCNRLPELQVPVLAAALAH